MVVMLICRRCGNEVHIPIKCIEQFPLPAFRFRCPNCGYEDVYAVKDLRGDHCRDPIKEFLKEFAEGIMRTLSTR